MKRSHMSIIRFLLLLTAIFLVAQRALAQEPPPAAPSDVFDTALNELGGYITLHVVILAGALQLGINTLKPMIIEPIGAALKLEKDSNFYTIYFMLVRLALTAAAYFGVWGGIAVTRAYVPSWAFLPDAAVGAVTIALVTVGQEAQHAILDYIYAIRDAKRALALPPTGA